MPGKSKGDYQTTYRMTKELDRRIEFRCYQLDIQKKEAARQAFELWLAIPLKELRKGPPPVPVADAEPDVTVRERAMGLEIPLDDTLRQEIDAAAHKAIVEDFAASFKDDPAA